MLYIWKHVWGEGKVKSVKPDILKLSMLICTASVHAVVTVFLVHGETIVKK